MKGNHKQFIALLLSVLMILSMTACGEGAPEGGQPDAAAVSGQGTEGRPDEEKNQATPNAPEATPNAPEVTPNAAEEANAFYEAGRACLYGLNGQTVDFKAAYENFDKALQKGKTEANFYLGLLCDRYNYPEKDYEKAKAYYEAAGENPYAQISLGFLYLNGQGVEKDAAKAKEIFDAVTAAGCADGYVGSGEIAKDEKDYTKALEYYKKAAEEGQEQVYIADAMSEIGYFYCEGQGVEQDYGQALEWYRKAADLGSGSATNNIGYLYFNGLGVAWDYGQAMEWFRKGADLGNAVAMAWIGSMYEGGYGVGQDYGQAMEWYRKGADLGDATSTHQIGFFYRHGYGVEQDYGQAMEWYRKGADLGNSTSMREIALLYADGLGVEQDYGQALEWLLKAADLGNAAAAYEVAVSYMDGYGVEKDAGKALEWLRKAASLGNADAKNVLLYYYGEY